MKRDFTSEWYTGLGTPTFVANAQETNSTPPDTLELKQYPALAGTARAPTGEPNCQVGSG